MGILKLLKTPENINIKKNYKHFKNYKPLQDQTNRSLNSAFFYIDLSKYYLLLFFSFHLKNCPYALANKCFGYF